MTTQVQSWYLSTADGGRQRLFAPGIVALFALAMLLVGWMALPDRNLHERLSRAQQSSSLTVAYLRAWLAADRDDWQLRLTLARHEALLGQFESARRSLEQVIAQGPGTLAASARRLRLNVLESQAYALEPDDPRRRELLDHVRAALTLVAQDTVDETELRALLRRALALEHHALARTLTSRLGHLLLDAPRAPDHGARAILLAKSAIGLGDFRLASELYWDAFDHAGSIDAQRGLLLDIARAELAGNRLREFFDSLEHRIAPGLLDRATAARLTRLALWAGRLDLADRFARRMLGALRMPSIARDGSWRWPAWLARLSPIGSAEAATRYETSTERPAAESFSPSAPFDAERYKLAFDVFLAQGKVDDAWGVARSAVAQRPADRGWRLHLAETSEWSQRPGEALEQRLALARSASTEDAPAAWRHVERLAEGLRDARALLEFLYWADARDHRQSVVALRIVSTLEMLGESAQAASWLEGRLGGDPDAAQESLMDLLVDLQERRGDAAGFARAVARADARFGPSPPRAVRIARQYYRQGQLAQAFDALERARPAAERPGVHDARAEKETDFWGSYATLAAALQKNDAALHAYRRLIALDLYKAGDLAAMATLIEAKSPLAATAVLHYGLLRFEDPNLSRQGLLTALRANRFDLYEKIWLELPPAARLKLEQDADFLKQRAAGELANGELVRAIVDYRRLGELRPDDHEIKAGMMWAVIAKRDAPELRRLLHRWSGLAQRESPLWGPFGAAWMALDEPERALPYFVRQARDRTDYLWWLAYADGLAAAGRVDAAWSLRHKAWTQMRRQIDAVKLESPERRERVVSLAMQFGPADGARSLLRELVRERAAELPAEPMPPAQVLGSAASGAALLAHLDELERRDARASDPAAPAALTSDQPKLRAAANELMLSYLLSKESFDSAQGWLLSRYAGELAQPAWARLSIALASNDQDALESLLEQMPDWLPKLDRIEAMKRVGQNGAAQTLAFNTFASRPDSAAAHQQFVDTVVEKASAIEVGHQSLRQPAIATHTSGVDARIRLSENTALTVLGQHAAIERRDPTLIARDSLSENSAMIGLRIDAPAQSWQVAFGSRRGMRDRTRLLAQWDHGPADKSRLSVEFGLHDISTESATLRMGGERDHLSMRASQPLSARDTIGLALSLERFATQQGTRTADGAGLRLEYGHQWRRSYPDIGFRASIGRTAYRHRAASDSLIAELAPPGTADPVRIWQPDSSTQITLGAQLGESARSGYGGKVRPFADLGLHLNSVSGSGFELRLGLRAAPFGNDRLIMQVALIDDPSSKSGSTREFGLSYTVPF